ncbi:MAG: lysophospholipid acyltransferase family protein [Candidatus Kapabacteria bacterium]|nr:lysophospholipid acyltransferase family protein [Ignavibacteriota bacterium]MCW5883476.1 lysophospholipid acyltransferase family protein [Candidatus Kapabacteria bacterium]
MQKVDIRKILHAKIPGLFHKYPDFIGNLIVNFMKWFVKVDEVNRFLEIAGEKRGLDFIESTFNELNFKYIMSQSDKEKIPSEGRLIIVSNHPLGGLDGLAMLKAISEVRKDVRVVANDILQNLESLSELFIPLDVYSMTKQKSQILNIEAALKDEQAIIIFPAGKVSRLRASGIRDLKWQNGAIRFSGKTEAPVLPIFIEGRNSLTFYLSSLININIGMLMLPRELFRKRNGSIKIKIGDLIPATTFKNSQLKISVQTKLLYKHIYKVRDNEPGLFKTEQTIIHPVEKKNLVEDLGNSRLLSNTNDDMKIYVVEHDVAPNIIKEISRLRELTFRKVGEGSGKTFDMDIHDLYYKHIVLWDDNNNEIVGAYRLGDTHDILDKYGPKGLYNSSLFELSNVYLDMVDSSLEVGRSFIQQKYWRSNALDYIWQGIGAYLSNYPDIKYLWGNVSLSDSYPEIAKALIVKYYSKWYPGDSTLAKPLMVNKFSNKVLADVDKIIYADDLNKDFINLKIALKSLGLSIPVLFRRYSELTTQGGTQFISWGVDHNLNNCIGALILVDLSMIKDEMKERYYSQKSFLV